ncbi:MAG: twin-arginine translocase TatA/TatE family subunit [Cyanobacteria bacterium P01_F01_bin.42]
MFGLGWLEVVLIIVAAVLVFGPKKLPAIGKSLGQSIRGLREELDSATAESEDDRHV